MTDAFLTLLHWQNLAYLLIALTRPLPFHMDPISAMTLLIGEYAGGIYSSGPSVSAPAKGLASSPHIWRPTLSWRS
ncbi:hypothetical protein C357_04010 [Citreicella sp. 357]|nr:hypothetical protein C357_04010 [Citreicella sp. 357]